MAFRCSFEDDLSCPVCCDVFINPVVLPCSHSICEDCVRRFWESKRLKECPVCRRRSSNDHPPLNLALRNLCETYRQKLSRRSSFEGESVCGLHKEKLKLFCLDDQEPVCLVCRDSRKHTDHRFCPVEEAVMDNKKILRDALQHLEEQQKEFEIFKEFFDEDDELIKSNAQDTESQIKEEFEELHRFLRDEEAARITALREEEKQKSQMIKQEMEETSRQISSLSCTIRDVEEQMNAEDVSFLQNVKATLQRARCVLPAPEPRPAVMTHFSNHLTDLKLTVLQKMQENFARTSYFRLNRRWTDVDFAAMSISDHPEEYNIYERFPKEGRNATNLFGDLLNVPLARATNIFPPMFSPEPTYKLPMFHKRLPPSPITQSPVATSMSGVDRPVLKSVFRPESLSPLHLSFRRHSSEESSSSGLQDMLICENQLQM